MLILYAQQMSLLCSTGITIMLHYNKHKNNKSVNYNCKWKQFGEAADNCIRTENARPIAFANL